MSSRAKVVPLRAPVEKFTPDRDLWCRREALTLAVRLASKKSYYAPEATVKAAREFYGFLKESE